MKRLIVVEEQCPECGHTHKNFQDFQDYGYFGEKIWVVHCGLCGFDFPISSDNVRSPISQAEIEWDEVINLTNTEVDVGGFGVAGDLILSNSRKVVGSWGPGSQENWIQFPDGRIEHIR